MDLLTIYIGENVSWVKNLTENPTNVWRAGKIHARACLFEFLTCAQYWDIYTPSFYLIKLRGTHFNGINREMSRLLRYIGRIDPVRNSERKPNERWLARGKLMWINKSLAHASLSTFQSFHRFRTFHAFFLFMEMHVQGCLYKYLTCAHDFYVLIYTSSCYHELSFSRPKVHNANKQFSVFEISKNVYHFKKSWYGVHMLN